MSVRRLVSVLSVVLVASATVVVAQPKKNDPKAPVAPAKEAAPAEGSAAGAGSAAEGSAVEMVEDPPADMEGINEDPDAPKVGDDPGPVVAVPEKKKTSGYPIEEVYRPITLPANMSEISLGLNIPVDPVAGTAALRARYGITRQVQLGLTYVVGGLYDDPGTVTSKTAFHPGKAVGLDVTVLLQDWIGLKIGVPVYIDPVAVALTLGAPMKFRFADGKLALGGLDDLLNIKIYRFPPSLHNELANAAGAANFDNNTTQSRGSIRFSGYAVYQQSPKMALIGRAGLTLDDFSATRGDSGYGGGITFIRAGFQYTVRKAIDLGASVGWDDLSKLGGFAPAAYLSIRI